ncbi:12201_t:CDS:2 [Cetraspora pellucida]|uniref:12201_t:CDS:1 n=1 Tax=Cetraspora pellucida TaxID=1433469 RepID=A0A9N9GFR5_9GLOM|nr:12201_t:CDS:2 [Cetraspora pellucida]
MSNIDNNINIITPTGNIYTGSLITISWQFFGQPSTQPSSLKIKNKSTGESTLIDNNLDIQASSKIWNVSVPEGIYFLSITDGTSEGISGDFIISKDKNSQEIIPLMLIVIKANSSTISVSTLIEVIVGGCVVVLVPIVAGIYFIRRWYKKERDGSFTIPKTETIYSVKEIDEEYNLATSEKKHGFVFT